MNIDRPADLGPFAYQQQHLAVPQSLGKPIYSWMTRQLFCRIRRMPRLSADL